MCVEAVRAFEQCSGEQIKAKHRADKIGATAYIYSSLRSISETTTFHRAEGIS